MVKVINSIKTAEEIPGTECAIFPTCLKKRPKHNCLYLECIQKECNNCNAQNSYTDFMDWREHNLYVNSRKWKENIIPKILRYDDYQCQICGKKTNRLVVHHIIFKSADKNTTPQNLVTLCDSCHLKIHGHNFGRSDIIYHFGWPINASKINDFLKLVRKSDRENSERFILPLSHIMTYICIICESISSCSFGMSIKTDFENTMRSYYYEEIGWSLIKINQIPQIEDGKSYSTWGIVNKIIDDKVVKSDAGDEYQLKIIELVDETGSFKVNLWNEQSRGISTGDHILLPFFYVKEYEGENYLNLNSERNILHLNNMPPDRLLRNFVTRKIIKRAKKLTKRIPSIRFVADKLQSQVPSSRSNLKYNILIDIENKLIEHDCPDWVQNRKDKKKFCKHITAIIFKLPIEQAYPLLLNIFEHREEWKFQ
ncbi:MAG: HNH endonuclease [Candidatus Hodarchaeales archaeon]